MWACLVAFAHAAEPSPAGEPPAPPSEPASEQATPPAVTAPVVPAASPIVDTTTAARHRVNAAISLYQAGETAQAKHILLSILSDSQVTSDDDKEDAYAWLADIDFAETGIAGAQSVMASLLARDPDYAMDPMEHPPDFCDAFEHLRADLKAAVPKAHPHPYPWQFGLPFGVGYFVEGKPLPGVVFGTLQTAGLATSLVTRVLMANIQHSGDPEGIAVGDTAGASQFVTLRATNLVSVCVGWSAWGIPLVVETAKWSAHPGPRVGTIELRPNGVALSGTF